MRIKNVTELTEHGNQKARKDALEILESAMIKCDPYYNVFRLVHLHDEKLSIGCPEFEAGNDPQSGVDVFSIQEFEHIYVVGAGKGVQRVAKALEEILGEYLTEGHVICKYGDHKILQKIGVTEGSHPTPDINCVKGCKKILELSEKITEKDLVFTIIANGGSSLLTLPVDGISVEEVKSITHLLQIELGVHTSELNSIRNHIDRMKGGKLARIFSKARLVNIVASDLNHNDDSGPKDFYYLVNNNWWLHNAPEGTTFEDALQILQKYNIWDRCPESIRKVISEKSSVNETVKYEEYKHYRYRIFGVMPEKEGFYEEALKTAENMGYNAFLMSENISAEATQVGGFLAFMADCIARRGKLLTLPAALIFTGELLVSVGNEKGIGGRNQECALAFANRIRGNNQLILAGVDTDGTDGPGGFIQDGAPECLAGAIVDGCTIDECEKKGYRLADALKTHNTTELLWNTKNGIYAEQGISMNDIILVLILAE